MVNNVNTFGIEAIILVAALAAAVATALGWYLGKRSSRVIEAEPDSFPDLVAEVLS